MSVNSLSISGFRERHFVPPAGQLGNKATERLPGVTRTDTGRFR
jgi:hypothetical protein